MRGRSLTQFAEQIDDLAQDMGLVPPWESYYPTPQAWEAEYRAGMSPRQALEADLGEKEGVAHVGQQHGAALSRELPEHETVAG